VQRVAEAQSGLRIRLVRSDAGRALDMPSPLLLIADEVIE
jgi:hypothetical protein